MKILILSERLWIVTQLTKGMDSKAAHTLFGQAELAHSCLENLKVSHTIHSLYYFFNERNKNSC